MTCEAMKSGGINARCASCCAGAQSAAASGCMNGSAVLSERAAQRLRNDFAPTPPGSGAPAAAVRTVTGDDANHAAWLVQQQRSQAVDSELPGVLVMVLAGLVVVGLVAAIARCSA